MAHNYKIEELLASKLSDDNKEVYLNTEETLHTYSGNPDKDVKIKELLSDFKSIHIGMGGLPNNDLIYCGNAKNTNTPILTSTFPMLTTFYPTSTVYQKSPYIWFINTDNGVDNNANLNILFKNADTDLSRVSKMGSRGNYALLTNFRSTMDLTRATNIIPRFSYEAIDHQYHNMLTLYLPSMSSSDLSNAYADIVSDLTNIASRDEMYVIVERSKLRSFILSGAASLVNIVGYSPNKIPVNLRYYYGEGGTHFVDYNNTYNLKVVIIDVVYTSNRTEITGWD